MAVPIGRTLPAAKYNHGSQGCSRSVPHVWLTYEYCVRACNIYISSQSLNFREFQYIEFLKFEWEKITLKFSIKIFLDLQGAQVCWSHNLDWHPPSWTWATCLSGLLGVIVTSGSSALKISFKFVQSKLSSSMITSGSSSTKWQMELLSGFRILRRLEAVEADEVQDFDMIGKGFGVMILETFSCKVTILCSMLAAGYWYRKVFLHFLLKKWHLFKETKLCLPLFLLDLGFLTSLRLL